MGVGSGMLQGLKDMVGANKKAVLEIADFNKADIKINKAAKPSSSGGATPSGMSTGDAGISSRAIRQAATAAGVEVVGEGNNAFISFQNFRKYRFNCQFNPETIEVSGFGGEELATEKFRTQDERPGEKGTGSVMASATTHIEMHFKLVFDKCNIQDAFYIDKFTLSGTNLVKGAATAIKSGVTGKGYSVQPEVEALTAIVRDRKKTLARFVWGDMAYEGIINSISAEYVMFNVNCEPIRAFVNVGMILYDEEVDGAHSDVWIKEYLNDIYSIKDSSITGRIIDEIGGEAAQDISGPDNAEALMDLFGSL